MKKVVSPCFCKVYTRSGNEATARAFCKIQFEDSRLSITGVIGPMPSGNCRGGAGQCVDAIREGRPCDEWTQEMLDKFCSISIKCFRSDKKLKLYLDSPARKLGHVVFAPLGNGLWKKKVSTLPADCNPAETEQGALTVYGSLMALMTYGTGSIRGAASTTSKAPDGRKSPTKPHTANTTYIIHSAGKRLTVVPRGHHASPACSFTVRGHFRHYKSGKTVWIAEYRKGTGRSRGKTYKIGGDLDD